MATHTEGYVSSFASPYTKCYMSPTTTSSSSSRLLIALEGCDASGKTTTLKLLSDHFDKLKLPYETFKFPVYESASGQVIKHILEYETFAKYYTCDEIDELFLTNFNEQLPVFRESCEKNIVIVDRYIASFEVYGMIRRETQESRSDIGEMGLKKSSVMLLSSFPEPDFTFFLYVNEEERLRRLNGRQKSGDAKQMVKQMSEINTEFQTRVRQAYLAWMNEKATLATNMRNNKKYIIIDVSTLTPSKTLNRIIDYITGNVKFTL